MLSDSFKYNILLIESGPAPITKNGTHLLSIIQGEKPMVKNVSVIDESGRLIGTTYPKRAKGLVKSGRARYVSCESEDTICLTCPPDMKEDNTMTDKSLDVAFTETINETNNADATNDVACNEAINATDSYTPSAEYALKMLEYIAKDTEALKSAVQNASKDTEDGLAHMIDAREETNRELIAFYTRMYNDFKPEKPVPKSNTMTQFEEIANMLKTLNRDEFDDDAWEALMDAARAQLTRN